MLTLNIESNLASPLSGNIAINVDPRASVRAVLSGYLLAIESKGSVPGLVIYDRHWNRLDWNSSLQDLGIEQGAKLYIGHDRAPLLRPVHIAVVGISTIIISIILLAVVAVLFTVTGGSVPLVYGVVIDAGSTHTEVFLYQWPSIKDHGTGVVHQKDSCEYEEGIAKGFDPVYIVSCVNNVTSLIPAGVPPPRLYLGATGGMRLLNLTRPTEVDLILMTLRYALQTSSVQVKTVNIIEGSDEAISSWISTNVLSKTLNQEDKKDTFGALDLGGASTQYAFAVNNQMQRNFSMIKDLELYGHKYSIASESFLCFGYFEAMDRNEAIMLMSNSSGTVNDPCLPTGFVRKFEAKSFATKACVDNKNFTTWLQNDPNIKELVVTGSSNYTECKKNIEELLDEEICNDLGFTECLPDINLGPLNEKFMAFSGFYYVVSYLNATDSLEKFINASIDWCSLSWDEIQRTQPKFQLEHVSRYCFASIYIAELLTSKYGFNATTWKNIIFTKEIDKEDVGWTLGFMIEATNSIPEGSPAPPVISLSIFLPLLFISLIMLFIGVLIIRNPIRRYYNTQRFEELKEI